MRSIPYINIHTHSPQPDSIGLISYSYGMDRYRPEGFFSAGIHPWSAGKFDPVPGLEYLETVPASAIGETGLDYSADSDREMQHSLFRSQLEIAQKRNMPVIIHCVKAHEDVISSLSVFSLPAVIFHGYIGSPEQTRKILSKGYYISFGERSLQSGKTLEALKEIPAELLFAETDTSPLDIKIIYRKIAEAKRCSFEELAASIFSNYKKVFPNGPE